MQPEMHRQTVTTRRGANHGLHILLSILTCGLWAVTGWPIAAAMGRKTKTTYTPLPPAPAVPPNAPPPQQPQPFGPQLGGYGQVYAPQPPAAQPYPQQAYPQQAYGQQWQQPAPPADQPPNRVTWGQQ